MAVTQEMLPIELPPQKGFYRTPFGFYVADHKSLAEMTRDKTFERLYRDGTAPIPNTYWSMVATLSKEDLARIENPDIREETRKAQELMLAYPAQFVGLSVRGNRVLEEPHGFGVHILDQPLRTGYIEVYDHDVRRIVLGKPQEKYYRAKLWVDESAKENDIRFAVRCGGWGVAGRRFGVYLAYEPRDSDPVVAGLGFRPQGNQAYIASNALNELKEARIHIQNAMNALR